MDIYSNIAYVIIAIIGIAVIIWYIRKRKQTVKAD
jgi:LPXTG-motif cell wall-anchored protein